MLSQVFLGEFCDFFFPNSYYLLEAVSFNNIYNLGIKHKKKSYKICCKINAVLSESNKVSRNSTESYESRYIVVYLASGSIKNRFPIDCVNIYLLSIFFSVHFSNKCVNVYLFSICFQQIQLSVKVWRYHLRMFTGVAENGL